MRKSFFLFLLPILSFAQSSKQFEIRGKLNATKPVDWIYLRYISGDKSITDSVRPKNGEFRFKGSILEPVIATLIAKFKDGPGGTKFPRELNQFFLEPSQTELAINKSFEDILIKTSKSNDQFHSLIKEAEAYTAQSDILYEQYDSLERISDKEGMNKIEKAIEQLDEQVKENVYAAFLKTHSNSNVALYAIKEYAGIDIDPSRVEPLFNSLSASVRAWPSARALKARIELVKKTAVGNYAIDFTQNDTLGRPVSLSSFRGKYVLIDFWASWCGPCRKENPNVVKVFNKFKDKNFTILSVSLDMPNARDKWLYAIHKDGLNWTHVSDLKYWDNAVAKKYGINAIPQNLLLDPRGKIIAKNLRGEDLDLKLAEILGKSQKTS